MVKSLVLNAILSEMTAFQVDSFRLSSQILNEYIIDNRLSFERMAVKSIFIENGSIVFYHEDYLNCQTQSTANTSLKHDFLESTESLYSLRPKTLLLSGDSSLLNLSERWLSDIESVEIQRVHEKQKFIDFLSKLKCNHLVLDRISFEVNFLDILNAMSNSIHLHFNDTLIECSLFAIEKLIEKSQLGDGIKGFSIENHPCKPFQTEYFIEIIKNAKFHNSVQDQGVELTVVNATGTRLEFVGMIEKLKSIPKWTVKECTVELIDDESDDDSFDDSIAGYSYTMFEIKTPSALLWVSVDFFIGDADITQLSLLSSY